MTSLDPVSFSFTTALLLGLSFGAGPCNIACLPYLGPIFLATDGGVRQAWQTVVPFSLGRMSGYALLGLLAGWAGYLIREWLDTSWVRWLLGSATIVVAIAILWRSKRPRACSSGHSSSSVAVTMEPRAGQAPAMHGGQFFMGMGMALNPCVPLTTIIFAAAATASAMAGLSLGIGFGMGAVLVPSLIFGLGIAHLSSQVREHLDKRRGALEKASVAMLVLMGVATIAGWIVP